jgi:tetratricopeptide (TPR) repeat protein
MDANQQRKQLFPRNARIALCALDLALTLMFIVRVGLARTIFLIVAFTLLGSLFARLRYRRWRRAFAAQLAHTPLDRLPRTVIRQDMRERYLYKLTTSLFLIPGFVSDGLAYLLLSAPLEAWFSQRMLATLEQDPTAYQRWLDQRWLDQPAARHELAVRLKRHAEAIDYNSRVIELSPKNAQAHSCRAAAYHQLENYPEALLDYTRAIRLSPEEPSYYVQRAMIYREIEDRARALEDLDRALALDPKQADVYLSRAALHYELDSAEECVKDAAQAIKLDACCVEAYLARGRGHERLAHNESALDDYTRAIELDRKQAHALFQRGRLYLQIGHKKKAHADLLRVVQLDDEKLKGPAQELLYSTAGTRVSE